ncbi:hypothetical protein HGG82_15270 [Marinomonas sp. M1K-6]|uniref:Uncharacterized protein n=1 Tax=Marinomonas profundi TaxID=2726122 RepID=A0A847RCD8_9GAMM|nr:hypothetical protein [Marinomonas profundi]NLQ18967.1 hypothetical protein [Marinomonas profundi]UDV04201.1 hypothetical protein J8N69_05460 [Marinomonas profundi]
MKMKVTVEDERDVNETTNGTLHFAHDALQNTIQTNSTQHPSSGLQKHHEITNHMIHTNHT